MPGKMKAKKKMVKPSAAPKKMGMYRKGKHKK